MVTTVCYKLADALNTASDEQTDDGESEGPIIVQILSEYGKGKQQ